MRRITPKRTLNINQLFSAEGRPTPFTVNPSTPIKERVKADPEWEPTYIKEVTLGIKSLTKKLNLYYKLRGIGWTRPFKKTTKKARKQSYKSRKRNRT